MFLPCTDHSLRLPFGIEGLNPGAYNLWVNQTNRLLNQLPSGNELSPNQEKWLSSKAKALKRLLERLHKEAYEHLEKISMMYLNKPLSRLFHDRDIHKPGTLSLKEVVTHLVDELQVAAVIPPAQAPTYETSSLSDTYEKIKAEVDTYCTEWNDVKRMLNRLNFTKFVELYTQYMNKHIKKISDLQSYLAAYYADIMFMKYAFSLCKDQDAIIDKYNEVARPLPSSPSTDWNLPLGPAPQPCLSSLTEPSIDPSGQLVLSPTQQLVDPPGQLQPPSQPKQPTSLLLSDQQLHLASDQPQPPVQQPQPSPQQFQPPSNQLFSEQPLLLSQPQPPLSQQHSLPPADQPQPPPSQQPQPLSNQIQPPPPSQQLHATSSQQFTPPVNQFTSPYQQSSHVNQLPIPDHLSNPVSLMPNVQGECSVIHDDNHFQQMNVIGRSSLPLDPRDVVSTPLHTTPSLSSSCCTRRDQLNQALAQFCRAYDILLQETKNCKEASTQFDNEIDSILFTLGNLQEDIDYLRSKVSSEGTPNNGEKDSRLGDSPQMSLRNEQFLNTLQDNGSSQASLSSKSAVEASNLSFLDNLGSTGSPNCPPVAIEENDDESKKQEEIRNTLYSKIQSLGSRLCR